MPHIEKNRVIGQMWRIETEMKKLNIWDLPQPTPEQYENMGAFGHLTMAFAQWLRYVLFEMVKMRLEDGQFPLGSMVAVQAAKEFDGMEEYSNLIKELSEFDKLFNAE